MTFEILYNEAQGPVKTAEIDATCLLEAEEKFKTAFPDAVYWEIGSEIDADFDFASTPHPSAHYERANTAMSEEKNYRNDLPEIPKRLRRLPVERGYPVPRFVAFVDGYYDFRVIGLNKIARAVNEKRCWICGDMRGVNLCFPIGPMCAINRVSSEPPSHFECAEWSARVCPFLINKEPERRTSNLPHVVEAAGCPISRQPGVILLWVTLSYRAMKGSVGPGRGNNGVLFRVGDPIKTTWMREGREATREECLTSIESGYPILMNAAKEDGPSAIQQLEKMKVKAFDLLPAA